MSRHFSAQYRFTPRQGADLTAYMSRWGPGESDSLHRVWRQVIDLDPALWNGMPWQTFRRLALIWADVGWLVSPEPHSEFTVRAVQLSERGRRRLNSPGALRAAGLQKTHTGWRLSREALS